jgi:uncharacterized protein (TIGR02145 family)
MRKLKLLFSVSLLCLNLIWLQGQTVKDIEGNEYKAVNIGTQIWMVENLKTTKYNDGTDIPLVTDSISWNTLLTPGYCWYNNDELTYKNTHGALYNWYVIKTGNLCPTGWHVPSDEEWKILTDYLGGERIAGGKLRISGKSHWDNNNTNVTNESNFSALPGGLRDMKSGSYAFISSAAFFWSSTENSSTHAWGRFLQSPPEKVYRFAFHKAYGYCIRCIKD